MSSFSDEIFADMDRADQFKAARPASGVSVDAIFMALRAIKATRKSQGIKLREPPPWFHQTVEKFKGQAITVSRFMLLAGQFPNTHQERVAVGKWLRATGHPPRKCGGEKLFDL